MEKRILLIMPYGSVGGMERLALTFYNHYRSLGYTVKGLKFIKMDNDIIHFGDDELFFKPYDLAKMSKVERAFFYLKAPFLIRRIIKKHKITHSIAFGDMANVFSSLTYTKEFKIGSIHALKSVEFSNPTFFNKIFKKAFRTTYKNLDKVVCISKAIEKDLIENCGYKFDNLKIIYNPHHIHHIVEKSNADILTYEEQKVFKKEVIVFLGRLSIQKSPWHLLRAFSIVKQQRPKAELVCIGDGDRQVLNYMKKLITKFDIEDSVHLLGRRSNPYPYIKAAKVLALSSHYEGTPNVIVEAISIGVPVVSSFCTKGIIELMSNEDHHESEDNILTASGIVTPNLFKGTLGIPASDDVVVEEQKLAEGLIRVLEDKSIANTLQKNNKELLTKFDINAVAEQYLTPTSLYV